MNVLPITEERKILFGNIRFVLETLSQKADEYINTFDPKDFFVFSNTAARSKIYQKDYDTFTLNVADPLLSLDRLMGELSSLLLKADREMNIDEMLLQNTLFDAYLKFKKSSSDFFSQAEKMFSSGSITLSIILDGAKKFKFDISSLTEKAS